MKFAHLADSHLGYRQYGVVEREEDFYEVFNNTIDSIIEKDVDFVIHSGDLFDFSRPPTIALLKVQEAILKLNKENIEVFAVAGNHDIIFRKNSIPPQAIYKQIGLNLISPKNPFFIRDDTFIGGFPYSRKSNRDFLKENLKILNEKSLEYTNRILVLHQGIDKYLPFEYELEIGDIPKDFHYYAFGHVHNRVNDVFGKGRLVYPGSLDIWKVDELISYKKFSKGYTLVELNEGEVKTEMIDVPISREFIKENIEYDNLKEDLSTLLNYIKTLNKKPILNIAVQGERFDRSEAYNIINNYLSKHSLILRPKFILLDENESDTIDYSGEFNPNEIILNKFQNKFQNEELSNFAFNMMDEILNKDEVSCFKLMDKFFNDFYH